MPTEAGRCLERRNRPKSRQERPYSKEEPKQSRADASEKLVAVVVGQLASGGAITRRDLQQDRVEHRRPVCTVQVCRTGRQAGGSWAVTSK